MPGSKGTTITLTSSGLISLGGGCSGKKCYRNTIINNAVLFVGYH